MSIIPYWFATYLMLWGIEYFRVRTLPGLVLAGAFYGWFVEALVAMTLFGGAGIPLPFSISWTGLAWHMLISVVVVWYGHRLAMGTSFMRSTGYSVGLGVFWALWSMAWFFETPPIVNDPGLYIVHAFAVTALMVLGHVLMSWGGTAFRPSVGEKVVVLLVPALYAAFLTVPTLGPLAVVIVVLAMVLYVPLRRIRAGSDSALVIVEMTRPVLFRNIATLFLAPLIASLAYAFYVDHPGVLFQFNIGTLFVTTPLGFAVFGWAVWRVYRPKAVPLPVPPAPVS